MIENLKFKCRNDEFVKIEALRDPVICSPPMQKNPFEISKTDTEFRKLLLADFTPNIEEENISILVGLDYYFSFITGNVTCSANDHLTLS